jgi:hypothetical protein
LGRPGAFARIVDRSEWLQCDRLHNVIRQRSAEVVPVAARIEPPKSKAKMRALG